EMSRRIVRIRLDAGVERPEERSTFRIPDLALWAQNHRAELVHAALTLVQAWLAQGAMFGAGTLGSYDDWAHIHAGILETIGVPGFLANRRDAETIAVSDDMAWQAFTAAWWAQYGDQPVSTAELYPIATEIEGFPLGRASSDR